MASARHCKTVSMRRPLCTLSSLVLSLCFPLACLLALQLLWSLVSGLWISCKFAIEWHEIPISIKVISRVHGHTYSLWIRDRATLSWICGLRIKRMVHKLHLKTLVFSALVSMSRRRVFHVILWLAFASAIASEFVFRAFWVRCTPSCYCDCCCCCCCLNCSFECLVLFFCLFVVLIYWIMWSCERVWPITLSTFCGINSVQWKLIYIKIHWMPLLISYCLMQNKTIPAH